MYSNTVPEVQVSISRRDTESIKGCRGLLKNAEVGLFCAGVWRGLTNRWVEGRHKNEQRRLQEGRAPALSSCGSAPRAPAGKSDGAEGSTLEVAGGVPSPSL